MKVAITIFRNGVSPRIDISDSLLIYEVDSSGFQQAEECNLDFEQPAELVSVLLEKKIEKIICGGCPQFFFRVLTFNGLEVIPGQTGGPQQIIELLWKGELRTLQTPGIPRQCRRRRRRGTAFSTLDKSPGEKS